MKLLLTLILLFISSIASAQQAFVLYGTNETDRPIRFQHNFIFQKDRFRLAGVTNLDGDGTLNRYQVKPRVSFDVYQQPGLKLALSYQKEWFWSEMGKREIRLDANRVGVSIRNQWENVRSETNYFAYDSTTDSGRLENYLTVKLPHKFSLNNQYWHDFKTDVNFNQFSVLYNIDGGLSLIVQHNYITNRDSVIRVGVWLSF